MTLSPERCRSWRGVGSPPKTSGQTGTSRPSLFHFRNLHPCTEYPCHHISHGLHISRRSPKSFSNLLIPFYIYFVYPGRIILFTIPGSGPPQQTEGHKAVWKTYYGNCNTHSNPVLGKIIVSMYLYWIHYHRDPPPYRSMGRFCLVFTRPDVPLFAPGEPPPCAYTNNIIRSIYTASTSRKIHMKQCFFVICNSFHWLKKG
jgi:hypothetical protein